MQKLVRAIGCALAVIAAPFLLVQGLANARVTANESLSQGLIYLNGFWLADVSTAFVQVEQQELSLELTVNETGLELARAAFAKEPLATEALFPLAIARQADGDVDEANALVATGLRIDKRNRSLGVLELQRVAAAQDLPGLFEQISRLAVLNPQLINDFVQPLTGALDDPESVEAVRDALAAEPVWAEAFWLSIPRSPGGTRNMYALRQQIDIGVTEESDAKLLEGLARAGLYAETLAHWDARFAAQDADPTLFMTGDRFAPIGWQTVRSGDISFSSRGEGAYDVYVENQASGELARQLVRLSPGSYAFSATVTPPNAAENLDVRLVCAGSPEEGIPARSLGNGPRFSVSSDCGIYWLILSGSAFDTRGAFEAQISDMRLVGAR